MGRVTLLTGTTKGLFLVYGRDGWRVEGPFCDGMAINHAIALGDRIWAAGGGGWHPPGVWRRVDGVWSLSGEGFDDAVHSVWSLARDGDRLLAGTKPAALYESCDDGVTWVKLPGLNAVPGADHWQPGAAGLVLHTILTDGEGGIWVGISAAGVFHSADGGATWEARNRRSNRPGPAGDTERHWQGEEIRREDEIFHCVHNMMWGAAQGLIYMQNHQGVYRSRDGALSWEEVTDGLPSTFGFPIGAHPHDPGTVWTFPLNGDSDGRFPPGASAAVWRSRDGGESWQDMREGLPVKDCFFTVLRQAMAVDRLAPAGVYFGTNSGSVFASEDEGDSWAEIARHLPTVLCVEVAVE
ncbi:MAG: WD40/YVTN/BNR-like repeat-containing protein [Paracoccaceae bacterium]